MLSLHCEDQVRSATIIQVSLHSCGFCTCAIIQVTFFSTSICVALIDSRLVSLSCGDFVGWLTDLVVDA